jgi:hypothetical protein
MASKPIPFFRHTSITVQLVFDHDFPTEAHERKAYAEIVKVLRKRFLVRSGTGCGDDLRVYFGKSSPSGK